MNEPICALRLDGFRVGTVQPRRMGDMGYGFSCRSGQLDFDGLPAGLSVDSIANWADPDGLFANWADLYIYSPIQTSR